MLEENSFYFIKDTYFKDFPDKGLIKNHDMINGKKHGRPCFYAFKDSRNPDIYWMIPVSSNTAKYKELHEYKTKRYGRCDTIHFGNIKGKECAFLIQNLCPVTEKYIESKYTIQDKTIKIDYALQNTLIKSSRRVLSITEKGAIKGLIFPNIKKIKKELINQLRQEKEKKQEAEKKQQKDAQSLEEKDNKQKQEQSQQKEAQSVEQNSKNQEQVSSADKKEQQTKPGDTKAVSQEKPKPIRRGGRVAPMQFPPSTRQPLAPIKRKTVNRNVQPQQAEKVQVQQPKTKTKRRLVLEPKQNSSDRGRSR